MTDKLNDKALLPCPFCGDTELSHGWSQPGVDGSEETGQVQCHSCDLLLWRPTEAEAIAAWNRRAPAALPEADGLEVGELVDRIAHKEQIGIWANEIAAAISLSDFLKDDWSFDDGVELEKEIVSQLRDILRSAFTHPEFDIYTALQSRDETIARLTAERDNALENYTRVWNERDAQRRRAVAAEQQVQKLTAEKAKLHKTGQEYLVASEAVFDWMNGNDLSADHEEQCPQDFARVCKAIVEFRSALETQEGGK